MNGKRIRKITQAAFFQPEASCRENRSPMTWNSRMKKMTMKKITISDQRKVRNVVASKPSPCWRGFGSDRCQTRPEGVTDHATSRPRFATGCRAGSDAGDARAHEYAGQAAQQCEEDRAEPHRRAAPELREKASDRAADDRAEADQLAFHGTGIGSFHPRLERGLMRGAAQGTAG